MSSNDSKMGVGGGGLKIFFTGQIFSLDSAVVKTERAAQNSFQGKIKKNIELQSRGVYSMCSQMQLCL